MWKPRDIHKGTNKGNCPNCGHVIQLSDFLGEDDALNIKGENDPLDMSEPNHKCSNCGTELVIELVLRFDVVSHVFKKST